MGGITDQAQQWMQAGGWIECLKYGSAIIALLYFRLTWIAARR